MQFIDKYLSHSKAPVVVGVSGGVDSLVLLHVLQTAGKPLIVAYLDHGLRDTSLDLLTVSKAAAAAQAEFFSRRLYIAERSSATRQTIEETGRQARYEFLFELADRFHAQAVAVGHTADDQVETVLMHLLRGAGFKGLLGMQAYYKPNPWSTKIPLIRPLLSTWRQDILDYAERNQLTPSEDETNLDLKYFRNRIRHELIPLLSTYNPQIKSALWNTAEILKDDYNLLDQFFQADWEKAVFQDVSGQLKVIRMKQEVLASLPPASQRAVLRMGMQRLKKNLRDIQFAWIERAREIAAEFGGARREELGAGIALYRTGNEIWLFEQHASITIPGWPLIDAKTMIQMEVPGRMMLAGNWSLEARWLSSQEVNMAEIRANLDPYQAWIQPDTDSPLLTLRTRKPGDRITPLGMAGHSIKLSDYMINVQLPQPVRERWPLVCLGNKIVWIPGYCVADEFRVKNPDAPVTLLTLFEIDSADRDNQSSGS